MVKKWLVSIMSVVMLIAGLFVGTRISAVNAQESEDVDTTSGASEDAYEYTNPADLAEAYDVIVIGAGGGGMAAALAAKEAGANVVIFEMMPIAGGNTLKSSAGMNASETKFQEAEGIEDDNDKYFEETLIGGKETNDQELLRYMVDHSASAIDWLDTMGITLSNLTTTGGMSVQRTHRPADGSAVGQYLVDGLLRNVAELEIPLFVNSEVVEIIEADGVATGVKVMIEGEEKVVQAQAIILATGGFGGNLEMVTEYDASLDGFVTTNHEGATGNGLLMAQALGAALVDMDQIQIHPTVQQETSYLITEAVRGEGGILVNQNGERFYNELETRDNVSAAIISLPEQYAYVVIDEALKERVTAINQYESMGFVLKGDTLEELAEQMEVPAENLQATLDTWNESVANQNDEMFGRTTGMEIGLEEAPYYAIKIAPGIHHTMGGVKINTNGQILREDGTVIEGLYAAGEASGGLHGQNRIGGNAVADIIIFGRQAGTQAADFSAE